MIAAFVVAVDNALFTRADFRFISQSNGLGKLSVEAAQQGRCITQNIRSGIKALPADQTYLVKRSGSGNRPEGELRK